MTASERQIIAEQFADITECADFEMGRSSMLDWQSWIEYYLDDPLELQPNTGNSTEATNTTMILQIPRTITLDNLIELQKNVVQINQSKNSTECHICDPRCSSSTKAILSIFILTLLFM